MTLSRPAGEFQGDRAGGPVPYAGDDRETAEKAVIRQAYDTGRTIWPADASNSGCGAKNPDHAYMEGCTCRAAPRSATSPAQGDGDRQ